MAKRKPNQHTKNVSFRRKSDLLAAEKAASGYESFSHFVRTLICAHLKQKTTPGFTTQI